MKKILLAILTAGHFICVSGQSGFLSRQREYARVWTAISEKEQTVRNSLREKGMVLDSIHILMVGYKEEKQLEIYAKRPTDSVCQRVAAYRICALSGKPGPKRREGDRQVPEGFYQINRFNPASNFYLSLGIDYPNLSDRKKSRATRLGGDIFIHGSCVTIGCLPMTDDKIREIYLYAVYARNGGQKNIPVYIFPFRMTDANFRKYKNRHVHDRELTDFWANLKAGYDTFVSEYKVLTVKTDAKGNYLFE
jgi:murein L,D-transpeptidase YafK